jgi:radical SAM superfamily enzyme YgiQ (UPF0313 family)
MKTKLTLVVCPVYGVLYPPLSLSSLAGFLRNKGYEVTTLDLSVQLFAELPEKERDILWALDMAHIWSYRDIVEKIIPDERFNIWADAILQKEPYAVGFSVYTPNLLVSLILAERIKVKNDKIKIIFGGPYLRRDNGMAQYAINKDCVDIVVVGEGELTLQEIIDSYGKEERIPYCKGSIIKSGGRITDCGVREPIEDLDSLPFPDFSDFNFENYKERVVPLLGSRGCLYNCAFCDEKTFWLDYRYRSADNLVEEIKHQISNYGINAFRFNDLMLNGNLKELERFCDLIIQEGIEIRWGGYITVRKMDRKLIEKMKRAGCIFLFVGIESGSQNILDKFKKNVKVEVAEELLRLFKEAGIAIHTGWIVGFPNESFIDFKQTLDFIKRNKKYMDRVAPSNLMTIPPGSPMSKNPGLFGIRHIVHPAEYHDDTTTLQIRQARTNYFNKYVAFEV